MTKIVFDREIGILSSALRSEDFRQPVRRKSSDVIVPNAVYFAGLDYNRERLISLEITFFQLKKIEIRATPLGVLLFSLNFWCAWRSRIGQN